MPLEPTIFAQVTSFLYPAEIARCAEQFPMARTSRSFSACDHFLALCFGQLTYRDSLRDVVSCLSARSPLQYHLGFRGRVTRTNFAYANQHRDWRVFAAIAEVLMRRASRLYQDTGDSDLPHLAFALDSSIIGLSAELFPWAYFRRPNDAALKLHLLITLRGQMPTWAAVTEASVPDMKLLDQLPILAGAFYVMDRGYLDFTRLVRLVQEGAWFVVRSKRHVVFRVKESRPVNKATGLRCDQTIHLITQWSKRVYPMALRRIRFVDPEHKRTFVFLTNNFELQAEVVCQLYKRRWQIELFFKWIKQHLRIRKFFGRTPNAVRCQIWSAICAYLLVAIAKKELKIERSLYEILQLVSVSAFERLPLKELVANLAPSHLSKNLQNTQEMLLF
jgi:hypothetical protein